ncbi:type I DNA topoisomerase [Bacteroidota bacterium]
MAKNLVLVESPSKAKTINKYLGRSYIVEATIGHIKNLPKTKLGVEIDDGFQPKLLNIRGKGDLIKKIKSLANKSDKIFIATDPDREGEAIAQDVYEVVGDKAKDKIERVLFNEITKKAVKKAMESPIKIDHNLVLSQRARRVMDRIIGYKISPFLWLALIESTDSSLSAGRVQSVALRLVCEREEEIDSFIKTEYWSIIAIFKNDKGEDIKAKLYEIDGKTLKIQPKPEMAEKDWEEFNQKNFAINNIELADKILQTVENKESFVINEINKREQRRNPYPPFITSTLQADSSKKLRYRPRKTMMIAQNLYEGINLGKDEGVTGLITYMRTDSFRMSPDITAEAKTFISEKYGQNYSLDTPRSFEQKKKQNVQDAHEAIRPTSVKYTPEFVKPHVSEEQFKLYELIWKRFIASQMEAAILETTTVSVKADEFIFRSSGTVVKFDGFMKVYDENGEDSNQNDNGEIFLPAGLEENQNLLLNSLDKIQHFTKPPPRFTESTLIKDLESKGIGRPSTYALIMSTILDRGYIEIIERRLAPTGLGKKVNSILVKNFPEILNVNFTARMEEELDSIATGEIEYIKVLNDFYEPFAAALKRVEDSIEKLKCEKCGHDMELKIGRFGKYLACSNYPNCENIKSLREVSNENKEPEYTGDKCPECGSRTIYREGKFGRFIGCEKYPDCTFTKVVTLGISCPTCKEGDVVTRRSKRGRMFYGCSRYPDCDFVSWTKPASDGIESEQTD